MMITVAADILKTMALNRYGHIAVYPEKTAGC